MAAAALSTLTVLSAVPACGAGREPDLTLAHANVCGGRCNAGGVEAVDAVGRAAGDADVVSLNEVCLPQVRHLAADLGLQMAFSATMPAPAECDGGPYGNALLAEGVVDVVEHTLPFPRRDPTGVVETRTVLCAGTGSVGRVCVTHLTPARPGPEEAWHHAQLERVAAVVEGAAVVVGDLNTDRGVEAGELADVRTGAGPNRLLVRRGLRVTGVRRVRQPRSDHPAVVVELRRRG